jgi:hypothetical protein
MMMQSADTANSLVGTWKLVSFQFEVEGNDERRDAFDEHPVGVVIITAEGRLLTLITASNRAPTAAASDLFDSMMAYSGLYRLQGNRLITTVDSAWHPAWVGTEQARSIKYDGDTLSLMSPDFPRTSEIPRAAGSRHSDLA